MGRSKIFAVEANPLIDVENYRHCRTDVSQQVSIKRKISNGSNTYEQQCFKSLCLPLPFIFSTTRRFMLRGLEGHGSSGPHRCLGCASASGTAEATECPATLPALPPGPL